MELNFENAKDYEYTREQLIEICEAAIVPQSDWWNRDSPSAQEGVAIIWGKLKAGCDFRVTPRNPQDKGGCFTDDETIWITVYWKNFAYFEGDAHGRDEYHGYLPTPKKLEQNDGNDWY